MKKLAKVFFVAIFGAAALVGCSTFTPLQGTPPVGVTENCIVLGRVTVDAKTDKSGYTILMEEALRRYPDADDILNIIVDGKKGFFGKTSYVMSAVVVKYK